MVTPPPLSIDHQVRVSVLEKETLWSLRGDTLYLSAEGMAEIPIPLSAIRKLRLSYAPTRMQRNRYQCRLHTAVSECAVIQNEHYAGFASFEDRSETYRLLISNIVRKLAASRPDCEFIGGIGLWSWLFQTAFLLAMFALLAVVMFYMWTAIGWLVVVKLLILAFYMPTAWRWIARNKPRRFLPGTIPPELLPQG